MESTTSQSTNNCPLLAILQGSIQETTVKEPARQQRSEQRDATAVVPDGKSNGGI